MDEGTTAARFGQAIPIHTGNLTASNFAASFDGQEERKEHGENDFQLRGAQSVSSVV